MIVELLTEHHLEFLSLKGGCTGSSESTHVKMPHCWKSHAMAKLLSMSKHRASLTKLFYLFYFLRILHLVFFFYFLYVEWQKHII